MNTIKGLAEDIGIIGVDRKDHKDNKSNSGMKPGRIIKRSTTISSMGSLGSRNSSLKTLTSSSSSSRRRRNRTGTQSARTDRMAVTKNLIPLEMVTSLTGGISGFSLDRPSGNSEYDARQGLRVHFRERLRYQPQKNTNGIEWVNSSGTAYGKLGFLSVTPSVLLTRAAIFEAVFEYYCFRQLTLYWVTLVAPNGAPGAITVAMLEDYDPNGTYSTDHPSGLLLSEFRDSAAFTAPSSYQKVINYTHTGSSLFATDITNTSIVSRQGCLGIAYDGASLANGYQLGFFIVEGVLDFYSPAAVEVSISSRRGQSVKSVPSDSVDLSKDQKSSKKEDEKDTKDSKESKVSFSIPSNLAPVPLERFPKDSRSNSFDLTDVDRKDYEAYLSSQKKKG